MPAFWKRNTDGSFKPAEEDDKNKLGDVEFKPEKLKEDIGKDLDDRFTKFQTANDEKMKPLLTMAENIEKDRLAREESARKATEKKNREDNAISNEDIMLDPLNATQRLISESNAPIVTAMKMTLAKSNLRDVMEAKPYYHGDIKTKVDNMVAAQSLDNQCRADVVENCYKAIVFDHMADIKEGKIKERTSGMTFEGGSTGAHKADSSETTETLTADEEKAASAMGIKKEDWIKSRRELSFV